MARPVQVTAHRGSSRAAPENTLAAIGRAIDDGADGCEIDLQELRDGTIIVFHDPDLARIAGDPRRVGDLTREDLRGLDVGSWFGPEFRDARIPTLEQVLDLARGRLRLNLELKVHGGERHFEERVVALVRRAGFGERCVITSIEAGCLRRVRALAPELRIGPVVTEAAEPAEGFDLESLQANLATAARIGANRAAGRETHVWTVNDPGEMRRLIELGVDGIITDEPALLRAVVDARPV